MRIQYIIGGMQNKSKTYFVNYTAIVDYMAF